LTLCVTDSDYSFTNFTVFSEIFKKYIPLGKDFTEIVVVSKEAVRQNIERFEGEDFMFQ
jgi:hypothetical protein